MSVFRRYVSEQYIDAKGNTRNTHEVRAQRVRMYLLVSREWL